MPNARPEPAELGRHLITARCGEGDQEHPESGRKHPPPRLGRGPATGRGREWGKAAERVESAENKLGAMRMPRSLHVFSIKKVENWNS
jgi:hypothetical protein